MNTMAECIRANISTIWEKGIVYEKEQRTRHGGILPKVDPTKSWRYLKECFYRYVYIVSYLRILEYFTKFRLSCL